MADEENTKKVGQYVCFFICCVLVAVAPFFVLEGGRRGSGDKSAQQEFQGYAGAANTTIDVFAQAIKPQNLQPFWMISVCNCLKVVVLFVLTGFDLPFKKKKPFKWTSSTVCMHIVTTGPLVFFALSGWLHDALKTWNIFVTANGYPFGIRCALFCDLWVMSSNYANALAVWSSLMIQSPAAALRLKPNYAWVALFGGMAFPKSPMATHWLRPLKWLYAVMVLPYALARLVFHSTVAFFMCPAQCFWCICLRCACIATTKFCFLGCFFCLFSSLGCLLTMMAVILTLGLSSYVDTAFLYWFWAGIGKGWPVYVFCALGIWAGLIVPISTAIVYGLLSRASWEQIKEGLSLKVKVSDDATPTAPITDLASEEAAQSLDFLPQPVKLSAEDRQLMIEFGREDLVHDFEVPDDQYLPFGSGKEVLDDSRVKVVQATLIQVSAIIFEQLVFLVATRYLVGVYTGGSSGFLHALEVTLTERSLSLYLTHLMDVFKDGMQHAGSVVQILSTYV